MQPLSREVDVVFQAGFSSEVVPVAGHEQEIVVMAELEYGRIGSVFWKELPQQRNLMTELLK